MRVATAGDLPSLQACAAESLALRGWQQPLPLWFVTRVVSAAAPEGHVRVVRWLLACGCSAASLPPLKPLVHACVQRAMPGNSGNNRGRGGGSDSSDGTLAVVRALVSEGCFDASCPRAGDGWTPLHACCKRNLVELAEALLSLGANANAVHRRTLAGCVWLANERAVQQQQGVRGATRVPFERARTV